MHSITSRDDMIDSRDVIARIAELLSEQAEGPLSIYDQAELETLQDLDSQCNEHSGWGDGVELIAEHYFPSYARELADDIDRSSTDWPYTCIDWEWAARELAYDYMPVTFDRVTYLARVY